MLFRSHFIFHLKTKKLSKPAFVGMGGGVYDNHNWGAITVDGKGYLHVVINGHHNPTAYSRTVKPLDISKWTAPEYVLPKGQKNQPNLSYATLNCDKQNNLYTAHRSTTGAYNNHIGLYRMTPEGKWQPEQTLIIPFKYIREIAPKNYDNCSVTLTNGEKYLLGDSQDVSDKNQGVLVKKGGEIRYFSFEDIEKITFN